MASTTSTTLSLSSSSTLIDGKPPRQFLSPPCISLPTILPLPPSPPQSQTGALRTAAYCRKITRNVVAMVVGEAPVEAPVEVAESTDTELPEIVKKIQETWNKVEDKYAVSSLAVAGAVALYGSAGMMSAIDKLPLVPGVLELVGIGYSGWFAYKNLVFKPDRDSLIKKFKETYNNIIGTSDS